MRETDILTEDGDHRLPGGSALSVRTWREWGADWASVTLWRETRPLSLPYEGGPWEWYGTTSEMWFVAERVGVHAMARCFDAGYGGDISSGFIRDVWSVTAPQGDLDAVVDALVALDYGQGQRASAYLGTPCLWPRCRERMDDLLRSRAGKPGQAVCADVVEWVRRWHDQGERVASPLSAGGGERPGGKGSPSCVPIVGAGGRDTSGNSGETREGDH